MILVSVVVSDVIVSVVLVVSVVVAWRRNLQCQTEILRSNMVREKRQ